MCFWTIWVKMSERGQNSKLKIVVVKKNWYPQYFILKLEKGIRRRFLPDLFSCTPWWIPRWTGDILRSHHNYFHFSYLAFFSCPCSTLCGEWSLPFKDFRSLSDLRHIGAIGHYRKSHRIHLRWFLRCVFIIVNIGVKIYDNIYDNTYWA